VHSPYLLSAVFAARALVSGRVGLKNVPKHLRVTKSGALDVTAKKRMAAAILTTLHVGFIM